MLRVGITGIGFMGWIHWLAWQKVPDTQVVAVCSRDPDKRNGDWTSIKGNFGPPGEHVDLSNITVFDSVGSMLSDPSIDLVDICLPPNLHCEVACAAMDSGKHVLCEKPMALTVEQCDRMQNSAEKNNRNLLVGHVLPFFPEFAFVRELAAKHTYGKLIGGEFKRTVSNPTWISGFFDPEIAGGPLLDLNVHDAHFIRTCFGQPTVVCSVGRMRDESVEYCSTVYEFTDPDLVVSSHGGIINQQGRPFTHGFEVHFEKATVQFEFAAFTDQPELMPLKVLLEDGSVLRPELGDGDPVNAFVEELTEVEHSIRTGSPSKVLDGRLARDAIKLCAAQTESVKSRSKVRVN